ncbi:MAG: hypothetical protein WDM86_17700 [Rhizomicrobium sp.]
MKLSRTQSELLVQIALAALLTLLFAVIFFVKPGSSPVVIYGLEIDDWLTMAMSGLVFAFSAVTLDRVLARPPGTFSNVWIGIFFALQDLTRTHDRVLTTMNLAALALYALAGAVILTRHIMARMVR